jgi:hypothetical protein
MNAISWHHQCNPSTKYVNVKDPAAKQLVGQIWLSSSLTGSSAFAGVLAALENPVIGYT